MREGIRDRVERLRALPAEHPRLARVRRAAERYRLTRGNHLSAAVAFYTVIASVPLLMVVFAALGLLLFWRSPSGQDLAVAVGTLMPPGMLAAVTPVLDTVVARGGSLVGIGAVGALWAGATWTAYLREALSAQYLLAPEKMTSPRRFLWDLGALGILGTAVLGSLAVTAVVTGLAGVTLEMLGLRDAVGGLIVLRVVGSAVVLALDWAVLCFVLARLPRVPVPVRRVVLPAAAGAAALELLKIGTALTVGAVSDTAGGAVFGAVLATLFFLFVLSRILVVCAAWIATDGSGTGQLPNAATNCSADVAR